MKYEAQGLDQYEAARFAQEIIERDLEKKWENHLKDLEKN